MKIVERALSIPAVDALVKKIQDEIIEGKQRAELAVENEKTVTYWKIGRHINEHLLENQDRAEYGQELFKRLSEKLGIGQRQLYWAVEFHKKYPDILKSISKLTWTHYITLINVKSEEKRKELEQKVIEEDLSVRELKELVKNGSGEREGYDKQKIFYPADRGIPYVYRIKKSRESILRIDCGFKFYTVNAGADISGFSENAIIKSVKKNSKYVIAQADADASSIYTYKALVEEIIDGDTAWMDIDLGFGNFSRQKLRLRNINAPDIRTNEGVKVKNYISSRLKPCRFVIVRTHYRDKFTRYLADIFYDKNITNEYELAEKGRLLNLELLEKGLVRRYG